MSIRQAFPAATTPLLDADGNITLVWRQFLTALWNRTGGASGAASGAAIPPAPLTPHASPWTYTPAVNGDLYVSGGGITRMTIKRGTGAAYPVGAFYGPHRLGSLDTVTITYMQAPTLVFFPS